MKRSQRTNVWETNSSAVHALAIDKSGIEPCKLPMKDGYIITDFGNFGAYSLNKVCFDQTTKLSYIATECYYLNHMDDSIEDFYTWKYVEDAICGYTGARGIRIMKNVQPEINHQELPYYDLHFCNAYDDDSVINFVFNKYVGINFTHD